MGEESKNFDVTWFNLILFITSAFTFTYGAKLLTKKDIRFLIRICTIFGGIAFILLSFLKMDNRLLWIAIIGIPVGAMCSHSANVLTTIGMFYFSTAWNAQHFHTISNYSLIQQAKILIWRECLLCFSRGLMLLFILPVKEIKGGAFISLLILALLCLLFIPYFQVKETDRHL